MNEGSRHAVKGLSDLKEGRALVRILFQARSDESVKRRGAPLWDFGTPVAIEDRQSTLNGIHAIIWALAR